MRLTVRTHKSCRWCLIKKTIANKGTKRPNVSKYARSISDGFHYALQKPVWLIWSCPKNYLSFRTSQGNFGFTKVLGGFFVSSESVSYPYVSGRKSEDMKQPCFHQKIIGDSLSLHRTFQETIFNNNRNILVLKCE